MILSVCGGIKDVSNLTFLGTTNYLTKIDLAIRRRFHKTYFVGRPNYNVRL